MILVIAIIVGIVLGALIPINISPEWSPYVAIAIIAALDSVFGGFSAYLQKKFNIFVFFTGFFSNSLLATFLAYIGNSLGVNLLLAATIVFGTRMFQNFAKVRYIWIEKYSLQRSLKKGEASETEVESETLQQ